MPSIFTNIITGELPGRFVWRDERCVGFLSIAPLTTGHVLVVPIAEVDHWLDLDPELAAHLTAVAQTIGRAQMTAFQPTKVALMIAGLEVPHVHLHVVPIDEVHDLDFANQRSDEPAAALDAAAEQIRTALIEQGATGVAGV
jgi:histidine triad (HIT) family protein